MSFTTRESEISDKPSEVKVVIPPQIINPEHELNESSIRRAQSENFEDQKPLGIDSEEEDMVCMLNQPMGDGRKREAKRHKNQTVVSQDELNLENAIRDFQSRNPKIIELEQ